MSERGKLLGLYTLQDGKPVPCDDIHVWGAWMGNHDADRILRHSHLRVPGRDKHVLVSTVFLGLDHGFDFLHKDTGEPLNPPILWETMVFDAPDDDHRSCRFMSPEAALLYHDAQEKLLRQTYDATLVEAFGTDLEPVR